MEWEKKIMIDLWFDRQWEKLNVSCAVDDDDDNDDEIP